MSVVIVPAMWVVRRGPETYSYGDAYQDTAVIFRVGSTAIVKSWSGGAPTPDERRTLKSELRARGITHIQWIRRRLDGTVHYANRRI